MPPAWPDQERLENERGLKAHRGFDSLELHTLGELAHWLKEVDAPALTGLVVDGETLLPGEGYFRLYGRSSDEFGWWEEQIRLSKEFDWEKLLRERLS